MIKAAAPKFSIFIFIFFILTGGVEALPKYPQVNAKASAILDLTSGQYIFEKNADKRMYPASTTKLMTAMVSLDYWKDPDEKISIPGSVKDIEPFKLNLKKGEEYSVRDLLYGLLMRSANDIAHTLGVRAYGSEKKFAKYMNLKAQEIGAFHCNFTNPHGLPDPDQYITPKDMCLITAYTKKYPLLCDIMATKHRILNGPGRAKTEMTNRNILLVNNFMPTVLGKTGFTQKAGRCFAGYVTGIDTPVVVVVYNSNKRWSDVKKLTIWAANYYKQRIKVNKLLLHKSSVQEFQQDLKKLGLYHGEPTGEFDRESEAAVIRFQAMRRMKIDGVLGAKTMALIYHYAKSAP